MVRITVHAANERMHPSRISYGDAEYFNLNIIWSAYCQISSPRQAELIRGTLDPPGPSFETPSCGSCPLV